MMNEPNTSPTSTFKTKDLNQAAFMWCQPGARLAALTGRTGRGTTVFFTIELPLEETDLSALLLNYANGETSVEPLLFCSKMNNLRNALNGALGRNQGVEK